MRIALVTESFFPAGAPAGAVPPGATATTTTLKAVADRLVDLGHTVRIVAPAPGLTTYRTCPIDRIRPLEPAGSQVRAALDAFGPDVVHVTSPGRLGRKALKHTQREGIASVVVEQTPVLDLAADYWRAKVADRADRVVVTSSWMVDRMAEFGVDAGLWRPGVDTRAHTPELRDQWLHDAWSRARSPEGARVVVGYVGGLHRRHGVRRLPEVAAIPGTRMVVIGGGSQREWLEARLPGAKVTGPLCTGDLTVALPSLDVLVHPGERETCCHALREAAAAGVPVVAPRAGGAPDVVRHLESGLLYDPADPRGLVRAVGSVVADPHRALLGRRGRELALQRSWTTAADEMVDLLAARLAAREPV